MRAYRTVAVALTLAFAAVGLVFLLGPRSVDDLFEAAVGLQGIAALPAGAVDSHLFRALAVAYMYLVGLLAWMMARRPGETVWPMLLAHAKLASAAVSMALCLTGGPVLILVVNTLVDGAIGMMALLLCRCAARGSQRGRALAAGA